MNVINEFKDEYRFLSNFWYVEIYAHGFVYPSVENYYQSSKCKDISLREKFVTLTPGQAKRFGKTVELRSDWEKVKYNIMIIGLWQKFDKEQNPELHKMLLDTYPNKLIEGNNWNDTYWGVCNGVGKNNLGNALMTIRKSEMIEMGAVK